MEEAIPDLGVAPFQSPAVANRGHHTLLVGVDDLLKVHAELFERLPVLAQSTLGGFEALEDAEIRFGVC